MCNAAGCENKGLHCYINPVDGAHFALGHDHFRIWASAIVRHSFLFQFISLLMLGVSNKVLIAQHKPGHLFTTSSTL